MITRDANEFMVFVGYPSDSPIRHKLSIAVKFEPNPQAVEISKFIISTLNSACKILQSSPLNVLLRISEKRDGYCLLPFFLILQ